MSQKTFWIFFVLLIVANGTVFAQEGPMEELVAKHTEKLETQCLTELETYCSHVTPGERRGLACLYAHSDKLSGKCEAAFYDAADEFKTAAENLSVFVKNCGPDIEKICSKVEVGGGRVLACLIENRQQVTDTCNEVLDQAMGDLGKKKELDIEYLGANIQ